MRRRSLLQAAALLAAPAIARGDGARVLKFIPYTDLATLDPVVTSNYAVRNHALMVFDTLYGVDDAYIPRPQMVAGHVVEDDGRRWTITLREGLRFHDGEPVRARDAVASIRRWAVHDILGIALAGLTDELSAPDDRTIRFRLKSPFPLLPYALGKTVGTILPVMPERLALSDPGKPVAEMVGSGPYRYLAGERLQGALNAYARFEGYVPRGDGEAALLAGPKIAHFDRVEWHTIPDLATAAAALQTGEVDWWEQPSPDFIPVLRRQAGIRLDMLDREGMFRYVRLNCLQPPFNNAAVRRAAMAGISQADIVAAVVGTDPAMARIPVGFFAPDSPMASAVGMGAMREPPDREAARRMLEAAGYAGQTTVVSVAATVPALLAAGEVVAEAWRRIGFEIRFEALEIAAAIQKIGSKAPVEQGGWSGSVDGFAGVAARDPAMIPNMRAVGAAGIYGWPDIPELATLRERFIATPDLAGQQAICREIQRVCFTEVPYIPAGICLQPTAYSAKLSPPLRGVPLFYGLRRG